MSVMSRSILEITQNREFLESVEKGWSYGANLNLLTSLPSYSECIEYEATFKEIFKQPLGYYLIKSFLVLNASDDKAVFVSDVKLYKTLTDPSARIHISKKIFCKYCSYKYNNDNMRGISVFDMNDIDFNTNNNGNNDNDNMDDNSRNNQHYDGNYLQLASQSHTIDDKPKNNNTKNAIQVYGQCIDECYNEIYNNLSSSLTLFDNILNNVLTDLEINIFPLFLKHELYKLYIQCITYLDSSNLDNSSISIESFSNLRVLGRGAFGFVNACIKKNTGHIYAMKCINKKRVMATDSVETIMSERNFLADMNSNFVTGLKYAVQDSNTLYLIIDLMVGGDLKFHLNKEGRFNIERSRFYASEVLLGLQHIHSKGIIYRDIKLENVLLDSNGHCKISDLGLAVRSKTKVRGYAGTPGYTAPEVCLQQPYDKCADFFSFGVMIYRFLSGRKPFQIRSSSKHNNKDKKADNNNNKKKDDKNHHRTGNELDKNVVEIEPEYPDRYFTPSARSLLKGLMCKNPINRLSSFIEIKNHPWFAEKIDFGLLESGNLIPPFIPNQDEINADSLRHIGKPPNDGKYENVKITKTFEKSLSKFKYISKSAQQKEIVDVLKKINKHYSFQSFINKLSTNKHNDKITISKLANIPSLNNINKFAKNKLNLKKEYGLDSFIPQYYQQISISSDDDEEEEEEDDDEEHDEDDDQYYDDDEDEDEYEYDEDDSDNDDESHDRDNDDSDDQQDDDDDDDDGYDEIGHHYDHKDERYNKIETRDNNKEEEEEEEVQELEEDEVSHSDDTHDGDTDNNNQQSSNSKNTNDNNPDINIREKDINDINYDYMKDPNTNTNKTNTNTNQCMGCIVL